MKNRIEFIEIPTRDFRRAVKFYENVLETTLTVCYECANEKMALFSDFMDKPNLALSWAESFHPSRDGVLIHFPVEDMDSALRRISDNGGNVVRPKTKIEAEGKGWFALFTDSEGNTLGLYSER